MQRVRSVEEYLERHPEWAPALRKLRKACLAAGLEESVKWGGPCYTVDGKNVVGFGAFTRHVALWFFQGVFLSDPDGVLVNAQEGKTKALRQWRFQRAADIDPARVEAYLTEAKANQLQGREVAPERKPAVEVPAELAAALERRGQLREAFEALTPGRRREYCEHVATAKRAETRRSRVEKIVPLIEAGVGLNDRYRR